MNLLSKIQQEWLLKACPECGMGQMRVNLGETENTLWCDNCDLLMDSDGDYTN